ncbi:hypothetical protein QQ045_000799 [Rhodiola kirilowii]
MGVGNCTTINEAIGIAPNSSLTRFVIYIKEGDYYEYVNVSKKKTNIMLVGDGAGKTVIKGNRSVVDSWTTFRSATLAKALTNICCLQTNKSALSTKASRNSHKS